MFNLEKANTPAPMNIKRPNKMIGRRVNPNVKSPFSTDPSKVFCRLDARKKGLEPQAWRVAALSLSAITDEDAYTFDYQTKLRRLAVDTPLARADEVIE
jgi:hypothetical protein